ncbi:carbohydrate ABC transporter permease [Kocuria sp. M1R5S2]|uniref:carbohydrate ABC transporter permease n=1 Tax=Kocuria rhizosphaerae TaxID=3376285 RepID=UPI0037995B7C
MTHASETAVRAGAAPRRSLLSRMGDTPIPWVLPLALILIAVFLYPIIEIVRLGFTDADLVGTDYEYTIGSYTSLFTAPSFANMLTVTALFVGFSVAFQMLLGFAIALMLDQGTKRNLRGTVITRTAVLSAWAIPGVIIGVIWSLLYAEGETGILNYFLTFVGVDDPIAFLSNPTNALIAVTVANIWRGTAFSMIFIYAGLQTFPQDVIEAAKMDGAGAVNRLFRVVIPILLPVLLVNMIVIIVDTFNTFDMVMAMTGGGPGRSTEVIALSIYNQIFNNFDLGSGAATATLLLVINVALTVVYFRFLEKGKEAKKA